MGRWIKSSWMMMAIAVVMIGPLAGAPRQAVAVTDQEIAEMNMQEGRVEDGRDQPSTVDDQQGISSLIGRLAVSLGVVFGLIALVMWIARRYLPQAAKGRRAGSIEILATRPLGARKHLMLVRVRDRTVLLGVTAQSIQMLTEMDQEPASWDETATDAGMDVGERVSDGTTSLGVS
jgi:flagellar biosynthetic protein FliO